MYVDPDVTAVPETLDALRVLVMDRSSTMSLKTFGVVLFQVFNALQARAKANSLRATSMLTEHCGLVHLDDAAFDHATNTLAELIGFTSTSDSKATVPYFVGDDFQPPLLKVFESQAGALSTEPPPPLDPTSWEPPPSPSPN